MKHNTLISSSLQKQVAGSSMMVDSEISNAMNELNFRSLLSQCGFRKKMGYNPFELFLFLTILPFIQRTIFRFCCSSYIEHQTTAQKDTFYRFKNNERFNWRRLAYKVAIKIITACDHSEIQERVLIADDSIIEKSGKKMELVSYHFDHKVRRSILGHCCLQLGYHNGTHFFPLDAVFKCSGKRPNKYMREMDKRTNGWRRRKEAMEKKTDLLIQMLSRAWSNGVDASFVLFDSWFSHDCVISQILNIGYEVICRLKKSKTNYQYQGKSYTLKQLWAQCARKKTVYNAKHGVKTCTLRVQLPKSGDVSILFISDGRKEWNALLCTDVTQNAEKIMEYYARRWAVEVFFRDAKQMLAMGKEQSKTFDAVIANHSLVMIRYLLLVFAMNKRQCIGPIGPLFREAAESLQIRALSQIFWKNVKELFFKSSHLLSYKIDYDTLVDLIENIENILLSNFNLLGAKL